MKKLFVVFFLGCMTVCSADASIWDTIVNAVKNLGQNAVNAVNNAVENSYTLSSGNSNSCYVLKSSIETIPSKVWYCGKHSGSACGSFSPKSEDSKIDFMEPLKHFEYGDNSYYCCDASVSQRGNFKIHPSSEKYPEEKTQTVDVGGGTCKQTVSIDACGKETKTPACDAPTKCPDGMVIHNNKCADPCPTNQEFKSATSDGCQCVSGMVEVGGVCETRATCSGDEDYIKETNKCKKKTTVSTGSGSSQQVSVGTVMGEMHIGGQNITGKPATAVTYETLFNDSKSCYVRKPSDDSDKTLFWCGKPNTNKCGDYKQSDLVWYEIYDNKGTDDKLCCCGGTETKTGEFRKCTTPGTRTYNKPVSGGFCQQTLTVDSCNRETILEDCNTPDPRLSMQGKTPIARSNMADCGLCSSNDDFKTCVLNSCYKLDANAKACSSKLKKSCSIKK